MKNTSVWTVEVSFPPEVHWECWLVRRVYSDSWFPPRIFIRVGYKQTINIKSLLYLEILGVSDSVYWTSCSLDALKCQWVLCFPPSILHSRAQQLLVVLSKIYQSKRRKKWLAKRKNSQQINSRGLTNRRLKSPQNGKEYSFQLP